jgi:Polyketide cyclase / dehydrase and lipid transport
MTQTPVRTHQQSIIIEANPEALYDLVSDITRTGEWSPVCKACWWDDPGEAGQIGAWFTGHNELPERTWETRSQVVAADRGREFSWIVGGRLVRWSFTCNPDGNATRLTESWQFLPAGIAMFQEKYADRAAEEIDARTRQAHDGIPKTLAAIKQIAETS